MRGSMVSPPCSATSDRRFPFRRVVLGHGQLCDEVAGITQGV
jgi:hypothetical protein